MVEGSTWTEALGDTYGTACHSPLIDAANVGRIASRVLVVSGTPHNLIPHHIANDVPDSLGIATPLRLSTANGAIAVAHAFDRMTPFIGGDTADAFALEFAPVVRSIGS